jgi:hypothetical protein
MKKRVQVLANLEPLMKMDRAELATQWQLLFKAPTPRGAQVDLLRRVLAWKLQSNNLFELCDGGAEVQQRSISPLGLSSLENGRALFTK